MDIQTIREQLAALRREDFGPAIFTDFESTVKPKVMPPVAPKTGKHPRVLFTAEELPRIRAALEKPDAAEAVRLLFEGSELETDGILPPVTVAEKYEYNYDPKLLTAIQSKAFRYALTGDEKYGYGAILAISNYIRTLDIEWTNSDHYRLYGYTAYVAACVYDWCYGLLSEDDKFRIIAGTEYRLFSGKTGKPERSRAHGDKMEIGFPPDRQAAVTGHGSELQLQRDHLACAIAFYDEVPTWWEYVAGRFYDEFVPVRKIYYADGMYPQGMLYAPFRFIGDVFAVWLIRAAIGESPYSSDMASVIRSLVNHEAGNGKVFRTGDANSSNLGSLFSYIAMISAYLHNDAAMLAFAKEYQHGYSLPGATHLCITPAECVILHSGDTVPAENYRDALPSVQYNGGYLGQMITRNGRESDSASTLTKIAVRTTANHDHQCSGSFHIYYKGMLTGDTGHYGAYGTDHWRSYQQASIAHNTLLVYNEALRDDELVYNENGVAVNRDRYWYVGGQYRPEHEARGLADWLSGAYERATLTGACYDTAPTPRYSYLAGDLTRAYDSETVELIERRMLTAYTECKTFPMLFFVCDRITAKSPAFKKTFLLQIPGSEAPTVSGKTVTVTEGDGKLVLHAIRGGDEIEPIGGEGRNCLVNGRQCTAGVGTLTHWGRVEISPKTGNKTDVLLNALYVTDRACEQTLTPIPTLGDGNVGVQLGGVCTVFATDATLTERPIAFSAEGDGLLTYYVSGVAPGVWRVSVDGRAVACLTVKDGEGLLTFSAPAGSILIEKQ